MKLSQDSGVLFLLSGIAIITYGISKGFSFLLVAGLVYLLMTARGLLLLRHWAWLTAMCGFSVALLFSVLGVIQNSVPFWQALIVWIVAGAIMWYFTGSAMKDAFGITEKDVKFLFLLPAATWVLNKIHQQLEATTIYVTHDQIEALTLGDRLVVMKECDDG